MELHEKSIEPVTTQEQIVRIASLAREIWNEHYVQIIGQDQVDYMLEKLQSPEAIRSQMDSGYEYYLACKEGDPVGYLGVIPNEPSGKMKLSKIYVKHSCRGAGIGTLLLEFSKNRAAETDSESVWLTVNRNNTQTMAWYLKNGFGIIDEVKQDIGSGFYMDDYILEWKRVEP